MTWRSTGKKGWRLATPLLTVVLLAPGLLRAEPMDLHDGTARWVMVRFEMSPPEHPAQTDTHYSTALPAWLEAGSMPGQLKVTLKGELVERHLLAGQVPVEGSFSDFIWVFDRATGHVRSATVAGVLRQEVNMGLTRWTVETPIRVAMDTETRAGLEPPLRLFGHQYHRFCRPERSRSCREVPSRSYDRDTGYVNAIGAVQVESDLVRLRSFSPLGEAVFSESELRLAGEPTPPVSAAAALLD
ncbi:MAG: hypothetical protein QNK04_14210 [Myxococcota bacterium]|nr:hypothetical protein [Myxococcota bacterium]